MRADVPSYVDIHEEIVEMASLAAERYRALVGWNLATSAVGDLCTEPAARWVAERAVVGQSLPVNTATVRALRTALRQLDVAGAAAD